jgi:hypothetical protein
MAARSLMNAVFVEETTAHVSIASVFQMVNQSEINAVFATATMRALIAVVNHLA